jgi:hypothetical protein
MDIDSLAGMEPAVDPGEEQRIEAALAAASAGAPEDHWEVRSLREADWLMRIVGDIENRKRDYLAEVARWQDALGRITRSEAWLRERLARWALSQRTATVKTFPLAHGTVATRAGRERVVVVDEAAAIAWAKRNRPEAVVTTEKLLVSKLGAKVAEVQVDTEVDTTTGELVPVMRLAAVDDQGPIPGLDVEVGEATATVTPLGA